MGFVSCFLSFLFLLSSPQISCLFEFRILFTALIASTRTQRPRRIITLNPGLRWPPARPTVLPLPFVLVPRSAKSTAPSKQVAHAVCFRRNIFHTFRVVIIRARNSISLPKRRHRTSPPKTSQCACACECICALCNRMKTLTHSTWLRVFCCFCCCLRVACCLCCVVARAPMRRTQLTWWTKSRQRSGRVWRTYAENFAPFQRMPTTPNAAGESESRQAG